MGIGSWLSFIDRPAQEELAPEPADARMLRERNSAGRVTSLQSCGEIRVKDSQHSRERNCKAMMERIEFSQGSGTIIKLRQKDIY
ncbi:hypothetical protein GJAV_G00214880 [Gymnothorax javanicus]|nr:hypothetical protein GJAV_G00214880 [Gymnothorax javanicus]